MYQIKHLLREQNISSLGNKDDLLARLCYLVNGKANKIGRCKRERVAKVITMALETILFQQQRQQVKVKPVRHIRRHKSKESYNDNILQPKCDSVENIAEMLKDLKIYLQTDIDDISSDEKFYLNNGFCRGL